MVLVGCSDSSNQVAEDEGLFRDLAYESQQVSQSAVGTPQDWKDYWNFQVETMFPPYREFITDEALGKCLESDLAKYQTFTVSYFSLEVGSSILDSDWLNVVDLFDGGSKEFKPSDFGRTYLARVKIFKVGGLFAGESERDIHYSVIDGKAYQFPNLDYCLEFKTDDSN